MCPVHHGACAQMKFRATFIVTAAIAAALSLTPLVAMSEQSTGQVVESICKNIHHSSCADYSTTYTVGDTWQPPTRQIGYKGLGAVRLERPQSLNRRVAALIFQPETVEAGHNRLRSQALAIVLHIRPLLGAQTDLVDAAAFWHNGNVVKLDHYIFGKDHYGNGRRNWSQALIKQVVQAPL